MALAKAPSNREGTLLYDGECGLCAIVVGILLRLDRKGRLRAVSLRDTEADRLVHGVPEEVRMESWHYLDHHGRLHSGGAVVAALGRRIPALYIVSVFAQMFPAATEGAYRGISTRRHWFHCVFGVECAVPSKLTGADGFPQERA